MKARRLPYAVLGAALLSLLLSAPSFAQSEEGAHRGGEASLVLPDLSSATFLGSIPGDRLLMGGLLVCLAGLVFGLVIYTQIRKLAVHRTMAEISELIYETCKTYLVTQGKFILLLEVFIGTIMVVYFGVLLKLEATRVLVILAFSLIGI